MAVTGPSRRSSVTRTGLIPLFLLMSLAACGKTKFIAPPPALLADCPQTGVPVSTNGDLVLKIRSLRVDLSNCNADKRSLRGWVSDMEKK